MEATIRDLSSAAGPAGAEGGAPLSLDAAPAGGLGPSAPIGGAPEGSAALGPGAQFPPPPAMEPAAVQSPEPAKKKSHLVRNLLVVLGLSVLAAGGYVGYLFFFQQKTAESEPAEKASSGGSSAPGETHTAAAGSSFDAGEAAAVDKAPPPADAAPPDAGLTVGDGGNVSVEPGPPGKLVVQSAPAGAKVYLDGSLVGKTPANVEVAGDEHRLAVIKPGHKLYVTDVKGSGTLKVELEGVSPPGGPAGIKVRCKPRNHDRYYVFVDGYHIGQLCPTERIGVNMGEHLVEIYDPITDSRKSFHVKVKETRLSLRVRVD